MNLDRFCFVIITYPVAIVIRELIDKYHSSLFYRKLIACFSLFGSERSHWKHCPFIYLVQTGYSCQVVCPGHWIIGYVSLKRIGITTSLAALGFASFGVVDEYIRHRILLSTKLNWLIAVDIYDNSSMLDCSVSLALVSWLGIRRLFISMVDI